MSGSTLTLSFTGPYLMVLDPLTSCAAVPVMVAVSVGVPLLGRRASPLLSSTLRNPL